MSDLTIKEITAVLSGMAKEINASKEAISREKGRLEEIQTDLDALIDSISDGILDLDECLDSIKDAIYNLNLNL